MLFSELIVDELKRNKRNLELQLNEAKSQLVSEIEKNATYSSQCDAWKYKYQTEKQCREIVELNLEDIEHRMREASEQYQKEKEEKTNVHEEDNKDLIYKNSCLRNELQVEKKNIAILKVRHSQNKIINGKRTCVII